MTNLIAHTHLDSPKHQVHHLTLKAPVHETVVDNIEQRIARAEQEGNRDHFQRSAAQNLHGAAWGFVLFLLDLQDVSCKRILSSPVNDATRISKHGF